MQNGDVQRIPAGEVFSGLPMGPHENDAEALAAALAGVKHEDQVLQLLQWLRGPWALAYWRASSRTLFFGRDVLGEGNIPGAETGTPAQIARPLQGQKHLPCLCTASRNPFPRSAVVPCARKGGAACSCTSQTRQMGGCCWPLSRTHQAAMQHTAATGR